MACAVGESSVRLSFASFEANPRPALKPSAPTADNGKVEHQPLAEPLPSEPAAEPHLELLLAPAVESEPAEALEDADAEIDLDSEPATQDPLKLYVRAIGDGRLLTPPEERELARRKDEGDEDAKRKLIESNLRLVMSITRHYTKAPVPLLDLIQERNLGLACATCSSNASASPARRP